MSSLLVNTLIPALLPAASDGVRATINYFSKGKQKEPSNFKEQMQLALMDIKRLETLSKLEQHNNTNMPWWVDAIKTLQRPFFGVALITAYIMGVALGAHPETLKTLAQFVSMFGFYLFGERAYMNLKSKSP